MKVREKAWLAGMIEADGYVTWNRHGKKRRKTPLVAVTNTDLKIIRESARLMKVNHYTDHYGRNKPMHVVRLAGIRAYKLIKEIFPYMKSKKKMIAERIISHFIPKDFRYGRRVPL